CDHLVGIVAFRPFEGHPALTVLLPVSNAETSVSRWFGGNPNRAMTEVSRVGWASAQLRRRRARNSRGVGGGRGTTEADRTGRAPAPEDGRESWPAIP